jgi:uncharacterized protein (DUF486 family)
VLRAKVLQGVEIDYLWAGFCPLEAAYFIFRGRPSRPPSAP